MKRFLNMAYWQLKLLIEYRIVLIAVITGLLYCSVLLALPALRTDLVIIPIIFSDPVMLGFIFIGVLVLFEKSDNTLPAQAVTPLKPYEYLWAKAISLLVPAIIICFALALSAYRFNFKPLILLLGVIPASIIFTFIGFAGVARVKTFNQFIIVIPVFLAPSILPLLNIFEITNIWIFNLVPTYSVLRILFSMTTEISNTVLMAHVAYLVFWIIITNYWAVKTYSKRILK